MSACAMSILHWNAIPVFADIDPETFNIDPEQIKKKISKKTKAIMVVDIFGHPAPYKEIIEIAKKNKLKVISDSAQSLEQNTMVNTQVYKQILVGIALMFTNI